MLKLKIGLAGKFTLAVHGGARGSVTLAEFDNLILDNGLNMIMGSANNSPYGVFNDVFVGSGSTPAAVNQSAMVSLIAGQTADTPWSNGFVAAVGEARTYGYSRLTKQFGQGAAAGNISEVGIGSSSANLFSRSLVKDSQGNPTTITVLADEYLTVVYELRRYPPADITTSVFAILDGVTTEISILASAGAITAIRWGTAAPQGFTVSGAGSIGWTAQPYTIGSFKRSMRLTYATGTSNGIISGVSYTSNPGSAAFIGGSMTYTFTPTFVKTNEFTLTFEVEVSVFRA